MKFLNGRKTYVVAALAAIAAFVHAMGWVDEALLLKIDAFLAAFGLAFLRMGVAKK